MNGMPIVEEHGFKWNCQRGSKRNPGHACLVLERGVSIQVDKVQPGQAFLLLWQLLIKQFSSSLFCWGTGSMFLSSMLAQEEGSQFPSVTSNGKVYVMYMHGGDRQGVWSRSHDTMLL